MPHWKKHQISKWLFLKNSRENFLRAFVSCELDRECLLIFARAKRNNLIRWIRLTNTCFGNIRPWFKRIYWRTHCHLKFCSLYRSGYGSFRIFHQSWRSLFDGKYFRLAFSSQAAVNHLESELWTTIAWWFVEHSSHCSKRISYDTKVIIWFR